MHDPRCDKLAEVLTRHSTKLQKGENALIEIFDAPDEIAVALIRAVRAAGAEPFVNTHHSRIAREIACGATEAQLGVTSGVELQRMKKMHAYVGRAGRENADDYRQDAPGDGLEDQPDEVGRPPLADSGHGPTGADEHARL
jgi:aminopeptidase